jgi:uncharacterized protein
MDSFVNYILTAFAMVFVIEGLLYALFPDAIRKMMAYAIMLPVQQLRLVGLVMATTGFGIVWLLSRF